MSSYFSGTFQVPLGGAIRFPDSAGNAVAIQANTTANNYTLTLPDSSGNSGQYIQTDGSGKLTWATATTTATTAADDILTGDAEVNITTTAGDVLLNAPTSNSVNLQVNSTDVAVVESTGVAVTGTISASTAFIPDADDGATLGTSTLKFSDMFMASGAVLNFNAGDITVTHDTNLLTVDGGTFVVAGTNALHLRNANTSINSSVDSKLDIDAITEVEITAPLIDLTGAVTISSTTTVVDDILPSASNGASLGSATLEFSNIYMADGTYLNMGIDQDVTIQHIADTGIRLNSAGTGLLQLASATEYISGVSATGVITISASSNLTIQAPTLIGDTAQSTDSGEGCLIAYGGVGIGRNLNVGGNVTVSGNVSVTESFKLGVNTFNEVTSRYDLFSTGNVSPIKNITLSADAAGNAAVYDCNAAPTGSGSIVHIFYTNESPGTANANISFANSNLYTGSGLGTYLFFNQTGQSASLIYLSGAGVTAGWRVINTGAQIF